MRTTLDIDSDVKRLAIAFELAHSDSPVVAHKMPVS